MIKGSRDTKVRISAGGQTYEYRTKEVRSKGETYSGIAVDGKSAGSMYAGKIDIISNDRGAGVNTKGELVSVDDVTITANGKITTEKVHSEKRVVYRTPKKVRIRKQVTAGDRVVVRAKKTEIDVDAEVITGYLKESLGEEAFEAEGEVEVNGKITAGGKISIEGGGKNSGEITATDRITVNGSTFDNTGGTVQSSSKIELNVQNTVNRGGYILSDGLTKEDMKEESLESTQSGTVGNTNEIGVRIAGELDNRKGVIKGKEVTVGGAVSNSSGIIIGIEKAVLNGNLIINEEGTVKGREVELNGAVINNRKGKVEGSLKDINARNLINDSGVIITDKALSIISDISNRNGHIYVDGDVRLAGESISNLAGLISSTGSTEIRGTRFDNEKGVLVSGGEVRLNSEETGNRGGVIQGMGISSKGKVLDNREGLITDGGKTELDSDRIENIQGRIEGRKVVISSEEFDNRKGSVLSEEKIEIDSQRTSNTEGTILSNGKIGIMGVLDNTGGTVRSDAVNIDGKISSNSSGIISGFDELKINGSSADNVNGKLESEGEIDIKVGILDNRSGKITGVEDVEINGNLNNTEGEILSLAKEVTIKSDDAKNIRGLIKGYMKTLLDVKGFKNKEGKVLSEGAVELTTPDELIYEGIIEGSLYTAITADKFTLNEELNQDTLSITADNGILLNNDLTARVLYLSTESDFDNAHSVKGKEYLSVEAKDISNDSQLLSDSTVYLKADNIYNRNRLEVRPDGTYRIRSGGSIEGQDVYLEVEGKVVNGIEEYMFGTYWREDGVFVDNRSVAAENPALISGTNSTTVIAGKLVNTGKIGETGTTYIETEDKAENASIGENVAGINGDKVSVKGKGGVHNIGGEIQGREITHVISENGKVINEATITSYATYGNQSIPGREETVRENIRNIGKIESPDGSTYVEGDRGIENIAGNIRGLSETYFISKNGNFEDRIVSLRNLGRNVVETRTEYREVYEGKFRDRTRVISEEEYNARLSEQEKLQDMPSVTQAETGLKKSRETSENLRLRLEKREVHTRWDIVDKTTAASGIIGMGGNTVINSGKDIILE